MSKTPVANLPPVSMTSVANCRRTPAANLPRVSTTPAANFATSSPCVVNTGGKFATGVTEAGGNRGRYWEQYQVADTLK
jgi:hypothetical protein